jgi:hypothetical protein
MYYTYSRHKTQHDAEEALEDYWAYGEVGPLERPRVRFAKGRWIVEFFDASYSN